LAQDLDLIIIFLKKGKGGFAFFTFASFSKRQIFSPRGLQAIFQAFIYVDGSSIVKLKRSEVP